MKDYCMRFADGQGWRLAGTGGIAPWLDMMASLLGLEAGYEDSLPAVIFIEKSSLKAVSGSPPLSALDKTLRDSIPQKGWTARVWSDTILWVCDGSGDMIAEIESPFGNTNQAINSLSTALRHIYRHGLMKGALPMHAALAEHRSRGVLLAGRGEAGKSTSCRRLPEPWHALSDEETFIVKAGARGYQAHPMPNWKYMKEQNSARTWNVEESVPLEAIFFIDKTADGRATPLGQGTAALYIFHSSMQVCTYYTDDDEIREVNRVLFQNASDIAVTIPSYILPISLKGCFWREIEHVLASPKTSGEDRGEEEPGSAHAASGSGFFPF